MKSIFDDPEKYGAYLAHFGIKGMKWGVRRTEAQLAKERGSKDDDDGTAAANRHEALLKSTKASTVYKYRNELSDDELRKRLNRIQMESQLKDYASKEKAGKSSVVDTIKKYSQTANDLYQVWNSPAVKAAREMFETKTKKG